MTFLNLRIWREVARAWTAVAGASWKVGGTVWERNDGGRRHDERPVG